MSDWLGNSIPPGSWVLDPFGASPQLSIEAAREGYRVLVTVNNPITRFLLEWAAHPTSESDLVASLADLGSAFKGQERIEPHIRGLYQTDCAICKQPIMADYFLWERGAQGPYARYYRCPHCGDCGERPATASDIALAAKFASIGLHRARALERVAALDDPDRPHVEEALNVYLPRAVYALFTLINKLDSVTFSPRQRDRLRALLLFACDQANTLWPYPNERDRPRQLTIPPHFRENNIWLALERGIQLWKSESAPIPLVHWPDQPPESGGICLFEGRLKDLEEQFPLLDLKAAFSVLPRPNQAYWALSALWAGWLWGREAAGPFKSVLRRRRFDWAWHTAAMTATLTSLAQLLPQGTALWALTEEAEPGLITATILAAGHAGFQLEDVCLRDDTHQAQISWLKQAKNTKRDSTDRIQRTILQGLSSFFNERGQPASYLKVNGAILAHLAWEHYLPLKTGNVDDNEPSPARDFTYLQSILKKLLIEKNGLIRFDGSEQSLEVGAWWLRNTYNSRPMADQVEMALVRYLQAHPSCTINDLDRALCETFPGLHTPNFHFIQVCLDSYGEQYPPASGKWQLRPQDSPANRRRDLEEIRQLTAQLGTKLGFHCISLTSEEEIVSGPAYRQPILWLDSSGSTRYQCFVLASANIGEAVFSTQVTPKPETRFLIVVPGGRANLAAFKLNQNPFLRQYMNEGWRIVKYRVIRQLVESLIVTPETLEEHMDLDSLSYEEPQLRLL